MVSTTEGLSENITTTLDASGIGMETSARKPLFTISKLLGVKCKTDVRRLCTYKTKLKVIIKENKFWYTMTGYGQHYTHG